MKKRIILASLMAIVTLNLLAQDLKYYQLGLEKLNKRDSLNKETKYESAIPYFEKSKELNKFHIQSYSTLLDCQLEVGNYEEALKTTQEAIELVDLINTTWLSSFYISAGYIEYKNGNLVQSESNYQKVLEIYNSILKIHPTDFETIENKAFIYCLMNKKLKALDYLKTIEINPYDSDRLNFLVQSITKLDIDKFYQANHAHLLNCIMQEYLLSYSNFRSTERSRYADYNFLDHKYKFLDDEFKINISGRKFKNLQEELKLENLKASNYADSLEIILFAEFDNNTERSLAFDVLNINGKITSDKTKRSPKHIEIFFDDVQHSKYFTEYDKQIQANIFYAAFYRFKEYVELKDGFYKINIKSPQEINISPTLFKIFNNYFKAINLKLEKSFIDPEFKETYLKNMTDGKIENKTLSETHKLTWDEVWKLYQQFGNELVN